MKNLIVQIYCSLDNFSEPNRLKPHDEIKEISTYLASNYAKRHSAEYVLLEDVYINFRHPTYERFRLWEEDYWLDTYDKVMYLDTDVFCWPSAPNIFDEYPDDRFKVAKHWSWRESTNPDLKLEGDFIGYKHKQLNDISFNAGMFILTKKSRDLMVPFLRYRDSRFESDDSKILHRLVLDSRIDLQILDRKWNAKNMTEDFSYFSHLWGSMKHKNPNFPPILNARKIYNELTTTF